MLSEALCRETAGAPGYYGIRVHGADLCKQAVKECLGTMEEQDTVVLDCMVLGYDTLEGGSQSAWLLCLTATEGFCFMDVANATCPRWKLMSKPDVPRSCALAQIVR